MKIYKLKRVAQFTKRERIADRSLSEAVVRAARGLVDADLGSGLIKQRVAREGQGKSGGYRMLIALRSSRRAIFLFGFAKNETDNIDATQLKTLREAASLWLNADDRYITRAVEEGLLIEVQHGKED
ncbi:hypothetical protein C2U70_24235 [Bradyrhizobium guangdongense]|uniref:type II toxin-antitoxin system RelE/ParE family toxin n=1 Tax=Bradyrhizobium guangdongense TaxID=1325090 RepID=UPI0011266E5A|nr:type II toxin-antitoxin system RelE/ParE family toxin [Bradyrhizobium guangdongense]TPQ31361.1 hypothetical protein C2U70_24235 [Bradyrhizobium guangdongense]